MTFAHSNQKNALPEPVPMAWFRRKGIWAVAIALLILNVGCFPRLNGRRTFGKLDLHGPADDKPVEFADHRPANSSESRWGTASEADIELVAAKPTIRSQDSQLSGGWAGFEKRSPPETMARYQPKAERNSGATDDSENSPSLTGQQTSVKSGPQNAGGSRIQLQRPVPQLGPYSIGSTRPRLLPPQPLSNTTEAGEAGVQEPEITPANTFFNSTVRTVNARPGEGRLRLRNPEPKTSSAGSGEPELNSNPAEQAQLPSVVGPPAPMPSTGPQQSNSNAEPATDGSTQTETFNNEPADQTAEVPLTEDAGVSIPAPSRERTVLDRLRGLYPSKLEESSTELLKKNLSRLQTPWNRRTPPPEIEVPPQQPTVTADASPSAAMPTLENAVPAGSGLPVSSEGTQETLQRLIAQLESDLNAWPFDESGQPLDPDAWRRAQTDLRLLYLISNRNADAVSAIAALSADEQEFWQSLMLGLSHYRGSSDAANNPNDKYIATSEQLKAALQHLQAMAPLSIKRLTFASRIFGFGSLDPFPTAEFNPGQPVLIYAEVENFRSELSDSGSYRSEFMAVVEMLRIDQDDPSEHIVESIRVPSIVDETQSRRTDYFQSYELVIPSHLTSGRYQVRLRLRDQTSGQQAESTIEFTVR